MDNAIIWAAQGTGFTFAMTAAGAALVFLFRNRMSHGLQRIMLGFAAGVMIAASVWSSWSLACWWCWSPAPRRPLCRGCSRLPLVR